MHIPTVDFDSVAAFVAGFDLATGGAPLEGFQEWLVVKLGHGNSLAWSELVVHLTFVARNPHASICGKMTGTEKRGSR